MLRRQVPLRSGRWEITDVEDAAAMAEIWQILPLPYEVESKRLGSFGSYAYEIYRSAAEYSSLLVAVRYILITLPYWSYSYLYLYPALLSMNSVT